MCIALSQHHAALTSYVVSGYHAAQVLSQYVPCFVWLSITMLSQVLHLSITPLMPCLSMTSRRSSVLAFPLDIFQALDVPTHTCRYIVRRACSEPLNPANYLSIYVPTYVCVRLSVAKCPRALIHWTVQSFDCRYLSLPLISNSLDNFVTTWSNRSSSLENI